MKALLALVRPFRQIANSLDKLVKLYELDLESRGVWLSPKNPVSDETEISYDEEIVKKDPFADDEEE